jgi:hypothetical protein
MTQTNHQLRLAARPVGLPKDSDWNITEEPVADPGDGELVVEISHISLDPAMRGWMNDMPSYLPPVELGAVMRAGAVGKVIASRHSGFAEGDHVVGTFGVQEYALSDGAGVIKVDPSQAPLPTYLGTLGMTGLTAYFGLFEVGRMQEGETVLVSGAAGAVGSAVGQFAKARGAANVVGIAGGPEKCAWIKDELGFDAAIDYKGTDNMRRELRDAAPEGIDVYFDNVGGEILEAALTRLKRHARIPICGGVSQYNATGPVPGPSNYLALIMFRASMQGFLVFDYISKYPEAIGEIVGWMKEGKVTSREEVIGGGIAAFNSTFLKLFSGENTGKLVLGVDR